MIDTRSLLGLETECGKNEELQMCRLIPKLAEIPMGQPSRTELYVSHSAEGFSSAVPSLPVNVMCEWHQVPAKALGVASYRYTITKLDPADKDKETSIKPSGNKLELEFAYSLEKNSFYQKWAADQPGTITHRSATQGQFESFKDVPTRGKLPKFYGQLVLAAERICQLFGDRTMLDSVYPTV